MLSQAQVQPPLQEAHPTTQHRHRIMVLPAQAAWHLLKGHMSGSYEWFLLPPLPATAGYGADAYGCGGGAYGAGAYDYDGGAYGYGAYGCGAYPPGGCNGYGGCPASYAPSKGRFGGKGGDKGYAPY
ncbi:unnamed protein product [Symbiodinium natans]|uniref:Uncharacterized protein n=1 Tax=Symbiodinium natans TaxID=878477 RepID=A0A812PMF5_9DINO|nr:unnamed protein product [Symbiodinium natans]